MSRDRLLRLEALEDRLAPAVSTWSGAVSNLWSDNGNWDVPPASGNDLVFPQGVANLSNSNDLTAGTGFGSLTISGSGYTIGGNAVTLTGPIDASQTSGSDTVNLPIGLLGATPSVTVNQSGSTLVLGGVLSGSNGVTEQGPGALDLTGTNTYTGTTTLNGGTLLVDGAQGQSPVTANSGTTVGGSGTIGTITTNSATVSPGSTAPAVLTDAGDLDLSSGSTFTVALNGATAGTGYSQLVVAGKVNLNGATLSSSLGFTPTGNSQFTIIKNNGGSAVTGTFLGLAQGATVTIGGKAFTISYTGGSGHDVVLTSQVASTTTASATPTSSIFGQSVTLSATVAPASGSGSTATPTGTVQFFSGTINVGTASVGSGGIATLSTPALPLGSDSITAQYSGDGSFTASTSTATTVTVAQASTTTALTANPTSANVGASVSLTATVAAVGPGSGTPTGTVEFFSGTTSLGTATLGTGGTGTLTTTALPLGADSVTAKYDGDTNFTTSTSPAQTVTVTQPTTTTLTLSQTQAIFGQSLTLTATVAPTSGSTTPTGSVTFLNGTNTLGTGTLNSSGVATLTTTALPVGSDSITAQYTGSTNLGASTSSATTVTVQQTSTTTALTVTPNPSGLGQSVTLTATVAPNSPGSGTPTGGVTFLSGTTTLGTAILNSSGVATTTTTSIPLGTGSITAVYAGDANFFGSTSPAVPETINQGTTTVTLTASVASPVSSQLEQFTATVTPVSPATTAATGTVEFLDNGVSIGSATLSGGTATFSTTTLPLGTHAITAVYQGDTNYPANTSSPLSLTVGDSNELFLNQVYLDVLHRTPDQAGLDYWRSYLELGYARKWVVAHIVHSGESTITAVDSSYQTYLARPATTSEIVSAVSPQSTAKGVQFNADILGSKEYFENAGGTNADFVASLAQDVLGTTLTDSQTSRLIGLLDQGVSRTTLAKGLIESTPGENARVTGIFQAILGRDPSTKELNSYTNYLKRGGRVTQVIINLLSSDELFANAQVS